MSTVVSVLWGSGLGTVMPYGCPSEHLGHDESCHVVVVVDVTVVDSTTWDTIVEDPICDSVRATHYPDYLAVGLGLPF